MSCNNLAKKKQRGICFNPSEEPIIGKNTDEDSRYNAIIAHYKVTHSECSKHLLAVKSALTIEDAIVLAATARDANGRKHGHQFLIRPSILQQFSDNIMMQKDDIMAADSFSKLHEIINKSKIKGVGELCIYDTTQRLGNYLGLLPDAIYLHRGTKQGAVKLIGKVKGTSISKDMLPIAFHRDDLSNSDLEDILCIYKKYF